MFINFNSLYTLASVNLPPHIEDRIFFKNGHFDLDEEDDCLKIINYYLNLNDDDIGNDFPDSRAFQNSYRSKHIVATWLIGYSLGRFNNLFDKIGGVIMHNWCGNIWMYTALVHDYGYFCQQIRKRKSIEEIQHPYYLLSDYSPEFLMPGVMSNFSHNYHNYFSYTYDQIKRYYKYSVDYHERTEMNYEGEMADHGIVGACVAFRKYCQKYKKNRSFPPVHSRNELAEKYEPVMYKAACIVAASHNIYKSPSPEYDYFYHSYDLGFLCHNSNFVINENNPLLLLLSIVDTIECCKRFSRKKNSKQFLKSKTVLSNIMVIVNEDEIIVDYTPLAKLVSQKSREMLGDLERHVENVAKLNTWTCLKTNKLDSFKISITI